MGLKLRRQRENPGFHATVVAPRIRAPRLGFLPRVRGRNIGLRRVSSACRHAGS